MSLFFHSKMKDSENYIKFLSFPFLFLPYVTFHLQTNYNSSNTNTAFVLPFSYEIKNQYDKFHLFLCSFQESTTKFIIHLRLPLLERNLIFDKRLSLIHRLLFSLCLFQIYATDFHTLKAISTIPLRP